MSVIIRLQNLAWSANALDIRQYFQGLSIPEGGVHIVGGEMGDAFIAFSTDEDARQAMQATGGAIKDVQISLLLSSRAEMQRVIEQARQQTVFQAVPQPMPQTVQNPMVPQAAMQAMAGGQVTAQQMGMAQMNTAAQMQDPMGNNVSPMRPTAQVPQFSYTLSDSDPVGQILNAVSHDEFSTTNANNFRDPDVRRERSDGGRSVEKGEGRERNDVKGEAKSAGKDRGEKRGSDRRRGHSRSRSRDRRQRSRDKDRKKTRSRSRDRDRTKRRESRDDDRRGIRRKGEESRQDKNSNPRQSREDSRSSFHRSLENKDANQRNANKQHTLNEPEGLIKRSRMDAMGNFESVSQGPHDRGNSAHKPAGGREDSDGRMFQPNNFAQLNQGGLQQTNMQPGGFQPIRPGFRAPLLQDPFQRDAFDPNSFQQQQGPFQRNDMQQNNFQGDDFQQNKFRPNSLQQGDFRQNNGENGPRLNNRRQSNIKPDTAMDDKFHGDGPRQGKPFVPRNAEHMKGNPTGAKYFAVAVNNIPGDLERSKQAHSLKRFFGNFLMPPWGIKLLPHRPNRAFIGFNFTNNDDLDRVLSMQGQELCGVPVDIQALTWEDFKKITQEDNDVRAGRTISVVDPVPSDRSVPRNRDRSHDRSTHREHKGDHDDRNSKSRSFEHKPRSVLRENETNTSSSSKPEEGEIMETNLSKEEECSIVISNLPKFYTENNLNKLYSGLKILDLVLEHLDSEVVAYIRFSSHSEAVKAVLDTTNFKIGKRTANVALTDNKTVGNVKQRMERHKVVPQSGVGMSEDTLETAAEIPDIQSDCIFLQGLPPASSDRDILDLFSDLGIVPLHIHVMLDTAGEPSGDAFCEFSDLDQATKALGKNQFPMGQYVICVRPVPRLEMMEALGIPVGIEDEFKQSAVAHGESQHSGALNQQPKIGLLGTAPLVAPAVEPRGGPDAQGSTGPPFMGGSFPPHHGEFDGSHGGEFVGPQGEFGEHDGENGGSFYDGVGGYRGRGLFRGRGMPFRGQDGPFRGRGRGSFGGHDGPFVGRGGHDGPFRGRGGHEGPFRGRGSYDGPFRGRGGHDGPFRGRGGHDGPFRGRGGHDGPFRGRGGHDVPFIGRGGHDETFRGRGGHDEPFRGRGGHNEAFGGRGGHGEPFRGQGEHGEPFRGDGENERPHHSDNDRNRGHDDARDESFLGRDEPFRGRGGFSPFRGRGDGFRGRGGPHRGGRGGLGGDFNEFNDCPPTIDGPFGNPEPSRDYSVPAEDIETGRAQLEEFGRPGCVLSMGNVHFNAGIDDILQFFTGFELEKESVIRRYNDAGKPTGDARVSFKSPDDARRAMSTLHRSTLFERVVFLRLL